jgi:lysophospholipase L1-like esterase
MAQILALGDCNTSGDIKFKDHAYVERFAKSLDKTFINAGYTMATTREMYYLFQEFYTNDTEIVLIQYGLVDSWKTFKYSPYVLYYPDNKLRKIFRKIIKKYKKLARKWGLNDRFGSKNVVSLQEYRVNIENLIHRVGSQVILIDTIPNKDLSRNDEIQKYNLVLDELSKIHSNCYKLDIYDDFLNNFEEYYLDNTHMNDVGYDFVTDKLLDLYTKHIRGAVS